jgi:hypothetical protein
METWRPDTPKSEKSVNLKVNRKKMKDCNRAQSKPFEQPDKSSAKIRTIQMPD